MSPAPTATVSALVWSNPLVTSWVSQHPCTSPHMSPSCHLQARTATASSVFPKNTPAVCLFMFGVKNSIEEYSVLFLGLLGFPGRALRMLVLGHVVLWFLSWHRTWPPLPPCCFHRPHPSISSVDVILMGCLIYLLSLPGNL